MHEPILGKSDGKRIPGEPGSNRHWKSGRGKLGGKSWSPGRSTFQNRSCCLLVTEIPLDEDDKSPSNVVGRGPKKEWCQCGRDGPEVKRETLLLPPALGSSLAGKDS